MDIVDAQVHLNQLLPDYQKLDLDVAVHAGVAAMDSAGVHSALVAESRA